MSIDSHHLFWSYDPVEYSRWHQLVCSWISQLSGTEQDRILGGTAIEAHKL